MENKHEPCPLDLLFLHGEIGDLSLVQHYIFKRLIQNDPVFSVDLARELDVSAARIARIVSGMEKKGWIERCCDDKDRRKVVIILTDQGKAQAEAVCRQIQQRISYLEQKIGAEKLRTFMELRAQIKKAMQDYPAS